jgi:hypothetical protein
MYNNRNERRVEPMVDVNTGCTECEGAGHCSVCDGTGGYGTPCGACDGDGCCPICEGTGNGDDTPPLLDLRGPDGSVTPQVVVDVLAQLCELATGAGLTFLAVGDTAIVVSNKNGVETRVAIKATLVQWKRTT